MLFLPDFLRAPNNLNRQVAKDAKEGKDSNIFLGTLADRVIPAQAGIQQVEYIKPRSATVVQLFGFPPARE